MSLKKWLSIAKKLANVRVAGSIPFPAPTSPSIDDLPPNYTFEVLDPENPGKYMWINLKGERVRGDDYSAAITNHKSAISRKMHQTHRELESENTDIESKPIEKGPFHTMAMAAEDIQPVAQAQMEQRLRSYIVKDRVANPEFH